MPLRPTRRTLVVAYLVILAASTFARWREGALRPRNQWSIAYGGTMVGDVLVEADAADVFSVVPTLLDSVASRHLVRVVGTRVAPGEIFGDSGVGRVHLIAFGTGGPPAIFAAAQHPDRIKSLTLIDAEGIEEFDLLGDHHLNQVLRRAQVILYGLIRWGTPHFGAFDRGALLAARPSALLATDRRGVRNALLGWSGPTLVLTSSTEGAVFATAREHERLVPQSLSGPPDPGTLTSFLDAVDRGTAPTRRTASPARIAAAAAPFDPGGLASAQGTSLFVVLLLLALTTLLSEDLACVIAGVLAARGSIPLLPAILACYVGIVAGDQLLYLLGLSVGRAIVTRAPFRWLIGPAELERAHAWFTQEGMQVVLTSRFLPGTRFPVYVTAGILRAGFVRFALWLMVVGAIWTPALVGVSYFAAHRGRNLVEALPGETWPWALGAILLLVLLLRVAPLVATREGRARIARRWWREPPQAPPTP